VAVEAAFGRTRIVLAQEAEEREMGQPSRIRAVSKDGVTEVRVLLSHDMDNGRRKDASGNLVPAHFITEVTAMHGDRVVLRGQFGPSVSRNPYLQFSFRGGASGDKVSIDWVDNMGDSRRDEVAID
jgi:sulfur-oxidizing protein SoxZ